jgi:hypothetical protein
MVVDPATTDRVMSAIPDLAAEQLPKIVDQRQGVTGELVLGFAAE